MRLKISQGMDLPVDAVTQTLGVLAKRRAGKSYFMRRMVEQLLKAGQQVVIVDPKGDQWGLRSSADGKSPGYPVVILGGERGDVQLEAGAGEIVAKLVVEERVSALLDLSLFRKQELATFMASFLENLYRLKAREQYRTPMMLAIDEADAIAPQKPFKGEERMLGAAEDIVRRGGQRGIGCTLVTQRSAVLNKNVLTQIQVLVTLRMIAPQDLAAMDAWIDVHGTPDERKTLMASLPSLPIGDAWIWSPGWPTPEGIFKRVHVLPIETFDSGATPRPGEKRIEPKNLADIDLDALKRQMDSTIEKAKADDPRELRRQIAELKANLLKNPPPPPDKGFSQIQLKEAESAGYKRGFGEGWSLAIVEMSKTSGLALQQIGKAVDEIRDKLQGMVGRKPAVKFPDFTTQAIPERRERVSLTPSQSRVNLAHTTEHAGRMPAGERKILTALAQYHPASRTKAQVAILTGYAVNGGSFNNYIAALRSKGLAEGYGELKIMPAGLEYLGAFDPLPTGQELLTHWLRRLGKAERLILEHLAQIYPRGATKETIGVSTGYEPNGGSFNNALSRLRTLELINGRGELQASNNLFGGI